MSTQGNTAAASDIPRTTLSSVLAGSGHQDNSEAPVTEDPNDVITRQGKKRKYMSFVSTLHSSCFITSCNKFTRVTLFPATHARKLKAQHMVAAHKEWNRENPENCTVFGITQWNHCNGYVCIGHLSANLASGLRTWALYWNY